MPYLALVQRVARRAGIAGTSSGKPDDVTGQPQRMQLICDYVAEAVRDIETAYVDWTFLRTSIDFFVECNCESLDIPTEQDDVLSVNIESAYGRIGAREQKLQPMTWAELRHLRGTTTTLPSVSLPTHVAIGPSGLVHLYPAPGESFTLRLECAMKPAEMTASDSEPRVPESHHDAIFWRALSLHYEADEAESLMRSAEARYGEWFSRMESAFLPGNSWSRTHAPEKQLVVMGE